MHSLPFRCGLVVMVYFGAEDFSFGEYSPGPGVSCIPKGLTTRNLNGNVKLLEYSAAVI